MFLNNYLNETKLDLLYSTYNKDYIDSIDPDNFRKVYQVFRAYGFYFIDDIILNYLEIFTLNSDKVKEEIGLLKNELGDKFVYKIGFNMKYLENICNIDG